MQSGLTLSIALCVGLAILIALFGGLIVSRLRNWIHSEQLPEPFTLQDLRDLRAAGQITPEEFETMRAALLGRWAGTSPSSSADAPPPESASGDPGARS
jgi:hypothetical protein